MLLARAFLLALAVSVSAQPVNDNFANRALIATNNGIISGSLLNATLETFENRAMLVGTRKNVIASNVAASKQAGEPDHFGNPGGSSVWYSWIAPGSGELLSRLTASHLFAARMVWQRSIRFSSFFGKSIFRLESRLGFPNLRIGDRSNSAATTILSAARRLHRDKRKFAGFRQ